MNCSLYAMSAKQVAILLGGKLFCSQFNAEALLKSAYDCVTFISFASLPHHSLIYRVMDLMVLFCNMKCLDRVSSYPAISSR